MFDHVKFGVSDDAATKAFFLHAQAPLGVAVISEGDPSYGVELGAPSQPTLCLFQTCEKPAHLHLAFRAERREQVDAFHRAALAAGGIDHGAPGLRPQHHANFTPPSSLGRTGTTCKGCATSRLPEQPQPPRHTAATAHPHTPGQ